MQKQSHAICLLSIVVLLLLFSARGEKQPVAVVVTAPAEKIAGEDTPENSSPGAAEPADKNGCVWRVAPTLEYDAIYYCGALGTFCTGDHAGDVLDIKTGRILGPWPESDGHGGYDVSLLYDEKKGLYGYYVVDVGWQAYELWPEEEFLENNIEYANNLNVFQSIDSDKVVIVAEDILGPTCDLSEAYISEKYALAYGTAFVTDFIFDYCYESDSRQYIMDKRAVRLNDKWGVIDKNGHTAVPFCFEGITLIDEETAFAKYDGKYGILDVNECPVF